VYETVEKLTRAMARGEEPAITEFYRRFFDWLYRTARRVSGRDESFCLDIVQDATLRVVRTIRPVAREAQLTAWLRLIIQTTTYDALRREQRRRAREEAQAGAGRTETSGEVGSRSCAEAESRPHAERLAWLRSELAALDPGLVRVLELRYGEGWTLARLGQLLGLSTGAVDGRLRRALVHLRSRAGEVEYE
jgi:RNA polymerase sigma factor (sigma-70 family)